MFKQVDDVVSDHPTFTDYLKSLPYIASIKDIDNQIEMHNEALKILSYVKNLFNDDVIECGELMKVLTEGYRDSIV